MSDQYKPLNDHYKISRILSIISLFIISVAAAGCIYSDEPPIIAVSDESGNRVIFNKSSTNYDNVNFNLDSGIITVTVEQNSGKPVKEAKIDLFWNYVNFSDDNGSQFYLQDTEVTDMDGKAVFFNKYASRTDNVSIPAVNSGLTSIIMNVKYGQKEYSISIGEMEKPSSGSNLSQLPVQHQVDELQSSPQLDKLVGFLEADKTDEMEYYMDPHRGVSYSVCVAFTRALAENATKSGIMIGGISLRDTMSVGAATAYYHTMNYVFVDGRFIVIEPQTDRIFTLEALKNDKEYHVYKYITIFPDTKVMTNYGKHRETIDINLNGEYNESEIIMKYPPESNTV